MWNIIILYVRINKIVLYRNRSWFSITSEIELMLLGPMSLMFKPLVTIHIYRYFIIIHYELTAWSWTILEKPPFYYHVCKSPLPSPVLTNWIQGHTSTTYLLKIHFIIIKPHVSLSDLLFSGFLTNILYACCFPPMQTVKCVKWFHFVPLQLTFSSQRLN